MHAMQHLTYQLFLMAVTRYTVMHVMNSTIFPKLTPAGTVLVDILRSTSQLTTKDQVIYYIHGDQFSVHHNTPLNSYS